MKAWRVTIIGEFYSEVVFAKTRGKARALALSCDGFEDAEFTDIDVHREPQLDKYFKEGKWHLDWFNPKERIILVKECGFYCDRDYLEWEDCEECSAKEYCGIYKDHKAEEEMGVEL